MKPYLLLVLFAMTAGAADAPTPILNPTLPRLTEQVARDFVDVNNMLAELMVPVRRLSPLPEVYFRARASMCEEFAEMLKAHPPTYPPR